MQEFKRYQEIIQRPVIQRALMAERETLLSQLQDFVASVQVEASDSHMQLVDMPVVVSQLCWVRQLEAKVTKISNIPSFLVNNIYSLLLPLFIIVILTL